MGISGVFSEELFLTSETGSRLYHQYAENLPIIDYHCHISPKDIVEDREFEDLGEMWLEGDHYKWRVMRLFGIEERLITGAKTSFHEKYLAFASVLPKMAGNPIYIWCALELKRYFGISEPLTAENAEEIYQKTRSMIREKHITRCWCLEHSRVKLLSTTEDPLDDLGCHRLLQQKRELSTRVITAFRPDRAMFLSHPGFPDYLRRLGETSGVRIERFFDLVEALSVRLRYFREVTGTTVSDNGVPRFSWEDYTTEEIEVIFGKAAAGQALTRRETDQYQSAFLLEMGRLYHREGCVMQLHIGTYLDANTKGVQTVGQSCGFDCTDDQCSVTSVGELLNRLTQLGELPKVLLYPLDRTKTETWAILAAGFCDGSVKGQVQLGAPWWFNDQQFGIARQFESCGNLYPVALSVGMLTDSRSFISYPRHEVYRRILCNYLGELCDRGEYFGSEENLREIIEDVCIRNANAFFGFQVEL